MQALIFTHIFCAMLVFKSFLVCLWQKGLLEVPINKIEQIIWVRISAQVGIQTFHHLLRRGYVWIPACAGMTGLFNNFPVTVR